MGISVTDRTLLMEARTEWLQRFLLTMPDGLWLDYGFLYKNYGKELLAREKSGELIDKIGRDGFRKWLASTDKFTESKLFNKGGRNQQRKYKLRPETSCYDCLTPLGKVANKLLGGHLINGNSTFRI